MVKVSPAVTPRSQPTRAACWYSCFQMLFQWKFDKGDKSKDPDKILEMLDKSPMLYPYDMKDSWGIDAHGECREAARYLGLRATGDGDLPASSMEEVLQKYGPIWVAGNWGQGNHVIVVTACDASSGQIRFINPYQNFSLTDTPGTMTWLNARGDLWRSCDASVMYWPN
jgi:papain like cysteine protease AvrRpt2